MCLYSYERLTDPHYDGVRFSRFSYVQMPSALVPAEKAGRRWRMRRLASWSERVVWVACLAYFMARHEQAGHVFCRIPLPDAPPNSSWDGTGFMAILGRRPLRAVRYLVRQRYGLPKDKRSTNAYYLVAGTSSLRESYRLAQTPRNV